MRKEKDFIGEVSIPKEALYGIQSWRARQNFPDSSAFPVEWFKAMGLVKKAYYLSCQAFTQALLQEGLEERLHTPLPEKPWLDEMIRSAEEIAEGKHFDHFIVPGISGGAGTSINMNINEIIVNASLKSEGLLLGSYDILDPYEDANIFQSTNDVVPSALKLAVMQMLKNLEESVNLLRSQTERLENTYRQALRLGYTQMQAAVPTSWGKLFSTYSDAFSRDWWRITRCQERIKIINLGGSAVGTGLTVPRFIIMEVTRTIQKISGLPLTRSENLADTTSNLDAFVEVHATLKSLAVNLEKMSGDLRMLASDLSGKPLLRLPACQVGSTIMPGKINPVIPEFVISAVHKIYSNDQLITSLAGKGCLELNAYLPAIGTAILESIRLLDSCCQTLTHNMLSGLSIDVELSESRLWENPAIVTAIIPMVGYHKASSLAEVMLKEKLNIFEANEVMMLLDPAILKESLSPNKLLQLGFSLKDF